MVSTLSVFWVLLLDTMLEVSMKPTFLALIFIAINCSFFPNASQASVESRLLHARHLSEARNNAPAMMPATLPLHSTKAITTAKSEGLALLAVAGTSMQTVRRDGEAEAKLLEVYRLVGLGQIKLAMTKAEVLVKAHPNFQLAQLVYGDLLSSRSRPVRIMGDVPESTARLAAPALAELREESLMRLKALRERPPPGTIPSQFLLLPPRSRHAIAVDASRSRLYLFENTSTGLHLLADYYISVGKSGVEKMTDGDLRTPLGVYFITGSVNPKALKDFYGAGALPINYPNPLDTRRGKTGYGIWLHGTPPNQFARPPKASDGCVVLANPDLQFIMGRVEIRSTPVVIATSLNWVQPQSVHPEVSAFEAVLQGWRKAKSNGNLPSTLSYYASDFNNNGRDITAYAPIVRKEIEKASGREIALKELSVLRWTDSLADTMVVTFGEVVEGSITGPKKRQYWTRQGSQWKIFFEGIIG